MLGRLAGRLVQLGQPVGGDRAAEPGPHDADVDALGSPFYGRLAVAVRSRDSLRRYE